MPGDTGEDKKTRDTLCFKVAEMEKQWCFFYYSFLQSYQLTQFTSSVFCPWKKFMNLLCDICLGLHCPPHCGNYHTLCPGEGNGNPLQCSCLENPRDGGAWWAAVSGVAQSRTRLKRLSSSSMLLWRHILVRYDTTCLFLPLLPEFLVPYPKNHY